MADPTRGITCPDMRRVVREALASGWEWHGWSGTTHAQIAWRDGTVLRFGATPSVASWKTTATRIEKVSGVQVWRKGNRRRSRKAITGSGFDLRAASAENARHHRHADQLLSEREELIESCFQTVAACSSGVVDRLMPLVRRIRSIESQLEAMHNGVEPFDFADLDA